MFNGVLNFFACGLRRRGSFRGRQIVYGKYLNNCEIVVRTNLTDWLKEKNIALVSLKEKDKIVFPLLSIMYLDDVEEYSQKDIEKAIQDIGFRGLLVIIHEDFRPRTHVEDNVIQLRSEKTVICKTRQNEEEIGRMKRFIEEKATMLAFSHDRKNPDSVLLDAVEFIQKEFSLKLVDVNDPKDVKNVKGKEESPLVIFCKNDSQLQEDIDNAKRNARCGPDVMLLVLTNRKNMHLVETKATEGFSMKSQLIVGSMQKRFRTKENQACITWLHKFLFLNGYNVSRKLSTSESLRRSFRQIRKREEEGLYKKLQNVSEEMERSVVIYLEEKQNLSLQRMEDDCKESKPFILFCRDGESAEDDIIKFIKERQAKSDLHMIVVLLSCNGHKPIEIPNVPNIQRLLIHSSQEPTICPIPDNGRVSDIVRDFLLVKKSDKGSNTFKKEEEGTHTEMRSNEEENKMSVATNSLKLQPKPSSKRVTQRDMRDSAQVRHALPLCDTDTNILEEKNRSCEMFVNQDKKIVIPHRQEDDQEIKNVLNPAPPLDPTVHDGNPKARKVILRPANEICTKNDGQSNTRADIIHDTKETVQAGLHEGQILQSPFSQDILHESSHSSKDNDVHHPTRNVTIKKQLMPTRVNTVKFIRQPLKANSQQTCQQSRGRPHSVPCQQLVIPREQSRSLKTSHSERSTSHTSSKQPDVYFTYGQSRLNYRLMEAVKFVETKGCIELIEVEDTQKSPLLVFCDGRKSENIVRVKQSSRCGSDVMLIVVTDTEHTELNVVEENDFFGARHTLILDSKSMRFNEIDNQKCMDALQLFLSSHNVIVDMKREQTVRTDSAGRRLRKRPIRSLQADLRARELVVLWRDLNPEISLEHRPDIFNSRRHCSKATPNAVTNSGKAS